MNSTFSDETSRTCPWGTSLAMAGAMVAGMAAGRKNKLALVAGLAAVAGIRWLIRRKVSDFHPVADEAGIGFEYTEGEVPEPRVDVCAVSVLPAADSLVVDESLPAIWAPGRNEPASHGAVGAQTVWFEMPEPLEAIPALPALTLAHKLPESFFSQDPAAELEILPKIPAITNDASSEPMAASGEMKSSGAVSGLLVFDPLPFLEKSTESSKFGYVEPTDQEPVRDELYRGPHRSVVPRAPINDGRSLRMKKLAAAVVLVIALMAMMMGVIQQSGWVQGIKRHGSVADGGGQAPTAMDKSVSMAPVLEK